MKKELTLSDLLMVLVMLVGWGISVEVRLATHKAQIETIEKMSEKVDVIYERVIRNEVKIELSKPGG